MNNMLEYSPERDRHSEADEEASDEETLKSLLRSVNLELYDDDGKGNDKNEDVDAHGHGTQPAAPVAKQPPTVHFGRMKGYFLSLI